MEAARRPESPHPYRRTSALFTDLYEVNMASVYFELSMFEPAVFSLFCRRLPPNRPFIVACGLEELLASLAQLRFDASDIDYLRSLGLYRDDFLEYLEALTFEGTVRAMDEGSVAFQHEPLLEITAPLPVAQLVETLVINKVQHASLAASKAALCYIAAQGRTLVEFGARRAHSSESAAVAARASYIAGFQATSNVEAASRYGIPPAGTMAHSFVQAFGDEVEAFRAFARRFKERTILLIDTYDTIEGARKAVAVAKEFEAEGVRIRGVRIDSGDLPALAREVRRVLDAGGCGWMEIFVSGNLSDSRVAEIVASGAPVDAFGVGTDLTVSADAPSLDIVYKLVRYGERDVFKLSPKKATYPGAKQVYRAEQKDGSYLHDLLTRADTEPDRAERAYRGPGTPPPGEMSAQGVSAHPDAVARLRPLLHTVMEGGKLTAELGLERARERFLEDLDRLPEDVRHGRTTYQVLVDPTLSVAIGQAAPQ